MAFYILFAIDLAILILYRIVESAARKALKKPLHKSEKYIYLIFVIFLVISFLGTIGYKIALIAAIVYLIMEMFITILGMFLIFLKVLMNISKD